jgi:hypothetical protein
MSSRRISIAAVLLASLAADTPALAAVSSPPAFPREVTVFPERDFAVVDGWPANRGFRLEVVRNGVVVGAASGTTDATGLAEINHPGGFCWTGFTPDILVGDTVRALETNADGSLKLDGAGQPIGDATQTALITAQPAQAALGRIVVQGTARTAAGGQIPVASLEQRIVNPDLVGLVGRRDIRAPGGGAGYSSTLTYDTPGGSAWTATYTGLTGAAQGAAVAGETRILSWMLATPGGDRSGITIFEAATLGGPGFGGCPLGASNAVTAPGVLNATHLAAGAPDVVFTGAAQPDATAVDVAITDGTKTITAPATMTAGSWTAAIPVAQLATLADGRLTAGGSYTVAGTPITGTPLEVVKDTVLPGAPTSNPAPGTYDGSQSLVLHTADPDAAIHYTVNGSEPTPASPVASGQLTLSSTLTVKALAVDPAGNRSVVSSLDYVITPKPPIRIEAPGAPPVVIVQKAAAKRLSLLRLSLRPAVSRAGLRRSGLRLGAELAPGTEVLRVRLYRGTRLVSTAFRFPGQGGRYSIRLTSRSIRSLKAGTYGLEVTPGTSRQNLGDPARGALKVR